MSPSRTGHSEVLLVQIAEADRNNAASASPDLILMNYPFRTVPSQMETVKASIMRLINLKTM